MKKYYVFHCNNRNGNYRYIAVGKNQSEAASKVPNRENMARELVCISECKNRRDAGLVRPRIV